MKRYQLFCPSTGRYLTAIGNTKCYTDNPELAYTYTDRNEAFRVAAMLHLDVVEIEMKG